MNDFLVELADLLDLPHAHVTADTQLQALEIWDSLTVVETISFVDERYSTVLRPREILECETVSDLYFLILSGQSS
jgi:acyl carrier protein